MPRLAPGVELLGRYRDSGLKDPPYLIRRGGRILQVSRLVHVVAAAADGIRSCEEMAAVASVELDRVLTGDNVRFLVENKLAPAGILAIDGDAAPPPPAPARDKRLFALRFRTPVLSPRAVGVAARLFAPLFRPAVVVGVLAGLAALDFWLFAIHGAAGVFEPLLRAPVATLLVIALTLVSGAFHECGHAAACRYSGARPGAVGAGLYLVWPVFFTNVTDAYRLDRRGRLRTDLGGIYFNAVFILLVGCAFAVTGYEPLLAVVVLEHVMVLYQLMPWLRTDGYYVISDLTGVPDIFSRVGPVLRSLIPGRPRHPAVVALRPSARRILFAYVASLAVFVVVVAVPAALHLPELVAVSWDRMVPHFRGLAAAAGRWDTVVVFLRGVAIAFVALPVVGLTLFLGLLGARLVKALLHLVEGLPRLVKGLARLVKGLPRLVQGALRLVETTARRVRGPVERLRRSGRAAPDSAAPVETTVLPRVMPVRQWLDQSGLAIVEGSDVPGGGAIDYFGFGFGGELVLVGTAVDRPAPEVAAKLLAAAGTLGSLSSDDLNRLLLDGPPFAETVARAARRSGRDWDERRFRAQLDETLARRNFQLIVLVEDDESGAAEFVRQLGLGCRDVQLATVAV